VDYSKPQPCSLYFGCTAEVILLLIFLRFYRGWDAGDRFGGVGGLLGFAGFEIRFGAVEKALYICAVADQNEYRGEDHQYQPRSRHAEDKRDAGPGYCRSNGAEGDLFAEYGADYKAADRADEYSPVCREEYRRACGDAFSAAELMQSREAVPNKAGSAAREHSPVAEEQPADVYCNGSFEHIAGKRNHAHAHAERTRHICRPCIAAALRAHIRFHNGLREDNRCAQRAHEIPEYNCRDIF
jgi:hypothetical protein